MRPVKELRIHLLTIAGLIALVSVCLPVLALPYQHDDIYNRNYGLYDWSTAFSTAWSITTQWMENEGRFYPTSSIYGVFVWKIFDARSTYAAYLVGLNVALGLAIWWTVRRYTRRIDVAAVALLAFSCGIQFRFFYDGFTAFAGLVPMSLLLTLAASVCFFAVWRGRHPLLSIPGVICWSMAITSYEVSLLMLPAIALVLMTRSPRSRAAAITALAGLLLPAMALLAVVLRLRLSLAAAPNPGYTIALNGQSPETAFSQLIGALPLSQYLFGIAPPTLPVITGNGVGLAVGLGVLVVIGSRSRAFRRRAPTSRRPLILIAIGAWMWLIPSLLAGITVRWQIELPEYQSYIYVVYQSSGVAIGAAGAYEWLRDRRRHAAAHRLAVAMLIALAITAGLTAGTNQGFARAQPPGPAGPDWGSIPGP